MPKSIEDMSIKEFSIYIERLYKKYEVIRNQRQEIKRLELLIRKIKYEL